MSSFPGLRETEVTGRTPSPGKAPLLSPARETVQHEDRRRIGTRYGGPWRSSKAERRRGSYAVGVLLLAGLYWLLAGSSALTKTHRPSRRWRLAWRGLAGGIGAAVDARLDPPLGDNGSYVAACVAVRDEHCDIREWVLHHASIGVSKFYIYDTMSAQPMGPVLEDMAASGLVEYQYVTNETQGLSKQALLPQGKEAERERGASLNWQRALYPLCLRLYGARHKWMAFIDADEFIVLQDGMASLPQLLQRNEGHAGIVLHWRMFSHSGRALRPRHGVLAGYTTCCDGGWGSRLYKSIVQPALVAGYGSPHHFQYVEGHGAVDTRGRPAPHPRDGQEQLDYWGAALHHYFSKSLYDFHLKTQRRSGDGGTKTLAELIKLDAQCRQECTQAEELGLQLAARYNLSRNAPATCVDPGEAYDSLGGPWSKWPERPPLEDD